MVLEETELLKLQYMNNVQTAASHISNIQDSDKELAEKVTQFLNISKKIRISKANYHSRKGAITVAESNKSSGKPLPSSYSNNNSQSPCSNNFCGRSTERRNLQNCSENRHSRSISQNSQSRRNYYGSNSDSSSYSTYNIAHFQIPTASNSSFSFPPNYSNKRPYNLCYNNRSLDISRKRDKNYQNRSRKFSQSPHRNTSQY